MKAHLKKGENVVVLSGAHKGKRGKVLELTDERTRALVEGVNLVKRHQRKSQERPQGGIVEREAPLHVSKLMPVARFEARAAARKPAAS